ncbi:hypothetical protein IV203_004974 [Nitzschia inconspicua]|uniref:Uncharacterized protein n=1 Tax=Nitzschia inconspicua TaxID=303405 RepID=A0A9K3KLG3_9STRA|nr:hypothetical protein IV203_004974 [Nitzschia inconspicua]
MALSKSFVFSILGMSCLLSPSNRQFASFLVDGFVLPTSKSRIQRCSQHLSVAYPPSHSVASSSSPFDQDQLVYIPQSDLDAAIQQEKKRHEKECNDLQSIIDQQRQELQRLQETERKERLKHKMYHDACWAENLQMLWSENHTEKMNRFQGRLEYLTDENLFLQSKLEEEKIRHIKEIQQLQQQLEQEKDKSQEAKDILGLERAYYETSVRLLEAGLEREGRKVKSLQAKLQAQKERMDRLQGRRSEEPLPQRNLQQHQPFEQQQQPLRKQYRPQIFEVQQQQQQQHHHQQQHSSDPQQYRVYRHHENQYFQEFQQQQQEQEYVQTQRQEELEEEEEQRQQQYHSDQFGFENAHYFNLQDQNHHQEQRQSHQQRTTRRYQPGPTEPQYYTGRSSSSTVAEDRYQRVAHSRRRPRARTAIPTMNGPHQEGGGFNDIRNRLY